MRLGLFTGINVVAALLFGALAYSNGYSAAGILLVVIGVLAVLQLAYVTWLVAIARLRTSETGKDEAAAPVRMTRASSGQGSRVP
jgi:hypothetical protein